MVAPSSANLTEQYQADYTCDGVSDNTYIHQACQAAQGGRVLLLPGTYNLSGPCDISGVIHFDAAATTINGAGNGNDAIVINGASFASFVFGRINSSGSGSAIHISGASGNFDLKYNILVGQSQNGNGIWLDSTAGITNSHIFGFTITGFNNGMIMQTNGSLIEAITTYIDYIYNCNICILINGVSPQYIDSNRWFVNVDASWDANAVGVSTNGLYDVFNIIIGNVPGKNIVLRSGANGNIINPTPLYLAKTANSIVDNSGNLTNMVHLN